MGYTVNPVLNVTRARSLNTILNVTRARSLDTDWLNKEVETGCLVAGSLSRN